MTREEQSAYNKAYYQKHKAKWRERYERQDKEETRQRARDYYNAHLEALRKKNLAYYYANRESILAQRKARQKANTEQAARERVRAYLKDINRYAGWGVVPLGASKQED